MKKPATYSPEVIFSIWVPDEVSGRASGRIFCSAAQDPGRAPVKACETVNPNEPFTSRVVILSRYLPWSLATRSASPCRVSGCWSISVLL